MPRCRICKTPTTQRFGLTYACSSDCAVEYAIQQRRKRLEREERQKRTAERSKLKTRQEWIKDAQSAFNAYIRERDKEQPCISCGRQHRGQYHAGHYRTTKAAPQLRFNEDNVWRQCSPCNSHLSGNLLEYRIRLIQKIGLTRVEALENDNTLHKWTIPELQAIKKEYQAKLKALRSENQHRAPQPALGR